MNIAIDIDGTWDRNPKMWFSLAVQMRQTFECKVYIVTGAKEISSEKRDRLLLSIQCPIICTSGSPKKDFLDSLGIPIDVWIDDNPASITSQFIKPNIDHEL